MSEKVSVYYLEIHHPSLGKERLRVDPELTLGSAKSNSVVYDDLELAPRHCIFRVHHEVLTIFQVAESGSSKIGRQALDNGRMYILEKSDKIIIGDLKIIVRTEKEEIHSESPAIDLEDEQTNPAHEVEEEEEFDEEELEEEKPNFVSRLKGLFKRREKDEEIEEEEEVEEVEEEVEEVEEEKTKDNINDSIYIPKSRIDEDVEEKTDPVKKAPIKKAKRHNRDLPGFIARFYAFIAEVIISIGLVVNVAPLFDLHSLLSQFHQDASPYVVKAVAFAVSLTGESLLPFENELNILSGYTFVSVLITWFVLNLVSNIILSANFGSAILAIRTEGSFVTARLKAVFRFLLSLITLPTLVTELPVLIRKRTLKEVVTASELSYRHFLLKYLGALVFLPFFIISSIGIYVAFEQNILEQPNFTRDLSVNSAVDESIPMQTLAWRELEFAISYPQSTMDDWSVSPFLSLINNNLKSSMRFLRARESETEIITMSPLHFSNIDLSAVKAIADADPFFAAKYPVLGQEIKGLNLTKESDNDLMDLFIDALAINVDSIGRFISERGPILTPYLTLKKYLITTFAINTDVQTIILGRRNFLEINVTNNKVLYVGALAGKIVQFDVQVRTPSNPQASLNKFKRTFLNAVSLKSNAVTTTDELTLWNQYDWLDHFNFYHPSSTIQGFGALTQFIQTVLLDIDRHPWAKEIITDDYRRTMTLLQNYQRDNEEPWVTPLFDALNVAPEIWQVQELEAPLQE